jgi:hypothetical protein
MTSKATSRADSHCEGNARTAEKGFSPVLFRVYHRLRGGYMPVTRVIAVIAVIAVLCRKGSAFVAAERLSEIESARASADTRVTDRTAITEGGGI